MRTAPRTGRRAAHWVLATVVLATFVIARADAQQPFELTPFVGAYVPLTNFAEDNGVEAKHQPSAAVGLRATIPSAGRLGFEGVIGVAQGAVEASSSSGEAEVSGRVILASVRALWGLGAPGGARSWHATTGLGVLSRGSDAYAPLEGTTDIGAVVGIGMRTTMGAWSLRFDLEDNISSATFGDGGSQLQNDLLLSAGLVIPLGNR